VLSPGLVAGIEGDFSGVDLDDSAADTNRFASGTPVGSGGISWARSQNWLASVRGRLGVALSPTALAYATGGVAWTNVDYSAVNAFIGGCPNCGIASSSGTETGFVAGGGLEIALDGNWLFRGEYLYYGFDDAHLAANFQSAPATPASTWSFKDLDVQTFRTGVGYKF